MFQILDHGYIKVVQDGCWGSDQRVVEAARMSTDKGFLGWGTPDVPGDEKLLRYLYSHDHGSPFEMGGMTFEIQAPILVFREWHRHRTQSYNEMSGRYSVLPNLYYVPSIERLMAGKQSSKNKQGSEGGFTLEQALAFQENIRETYALTRKSYDLMLSGDLAREIARVVIPVGQYSRMQAQGLLRNWLAFLTLRQKPDAQWEIRQFANAAAGFLTERFPRTMALFNEYSEKALCAHCRQELVA